MSRRETILGSVDDLVSDFLYYDRKEDEKLPRGSIDEAVRAGEVTMDEIVTRFQEQLKKGLS